MAQIYLCFVWHMHQPFYKDSPSGEYRLPWTRLHALKDYYGMVKILGEFPEVRQTFNLAPSLLVQIADYASGSASDPFLSVALKPAEELSESETGFLLQNSFNANPSRLIYRYPRYGELFDAWQRSDHDPALARRLFGHAELRDLQVLSQVAWFDEEDLSGDPEIDALVKKGRGFDLRDQELMGRKQSEALRRVLPVYQKFSQSGQIEISTTPFYHPILPLLCDSDIARVSHPGISLPGKFSYSQDAREQLTRAREYCTREFGRAPAGVWPSEGAVSDEALALAVECGFTWSASDNGVLARTLQRDATPQVTYRPYLWQQGSNQMRMIFRDHHLSDLIGFVYSRMDAADAATDFLGQIRENCRGMLSQGRDALVPIILDGENAWEYYDRNGRPFLRELYGRIQGDPEMKAVTVSEALTRIEPERIDHIFPGSWIDANLDIWIGAEEDNRAWECLLHARRTYDEALASGVPLDAEKKRQAFEELLIAEGSDWCWWYGPEHQSVNRPEFDQLFRDHLANVYRALNLAAPEELSRPILHSVVIASHDVPTGLVRPVIDGKVSSPGEWMGAGRYRVDNRSGSMHGQRSVIRELYYGSDGDSLYLRLDFEDDAASGLGGALVNLRIAPVSDPSRITATSLPVSRGIVDGIEYAFGKIYEIRVPLSAIGASTGQPVRFQLSMSKDGLPLDAQPAQGWFEVSTA